MGLAAVHIREHSEERPGGFPARHEAFRPALPRKRGTHLPSTGFLLLSSLPLPHLVVVNVLVGLAEEGVAVLVLRIDSTVDILSVITPTQCIPVPDINKPQSTHSFAMTCIWIHLNRKAQNDNSKLQIPIPHSLKLHHEYASLIRGS